jgi:NADPH-dependent 2,4-dienoyl-CoA reductase/sulfur reductase-like enzyme/rhodanese-related sulfurtransferase/two-component sensor histidine kinase
MPDDTPAKTARDTAFEKDPLKFAALMAHQMQSPLATTSSLLQTVLSEYSGPLLPQQRGILEKANARCQSAITAVRRLLAIMQAQSGKAAAARPASLADAIAQAHQHFSSDAGARGISLSVHGSAGDSYVKLGESQLVEMLDALVGNALKYTPDHGKVRISLAGAAVAGMATVSVSDSGIGVPEKYWSSIFEPFFRSPTATESARPGVGLGLAFVKSMVTAAGGTVKVGRSDMGGADFTVELPTAPAPDMQPETGRTAQAMRVVIIGGVTAGPKAAAKIIRLMPDADVTVVERGTVMSYAGCGLPYYVGGLVKDQKRLTSSPAGVVRDPVFFRNVKNVHVMNRAEAVEIARDRKRVRVRDLFSGRETWLPYDKLLLATGASPNVPPALETKMENVFTLHGVRDAEGIRTALADKKARDVVIIGGGLLGIEMTQAIVSRGARVTILEAKPQIMPILDEDMALLVERHLESNGVRVLTNTKATGLRGNARVSEVVTDNGSFASDMVILALGVHPNVQLARDAGIGLGATGAIAVDAGMRTDDPDVYAAGDCAETRNLLTGLPCYFPLGATAAKQGRVAASNICGGNDTFPGVMGSCICRVFEYNVARTGLGAAQAAGLGYDVVSVCVPGPDREHFMPTAAMLMLKLVVDRRSRRLLGVQATGRGDADKRVDVSSIAIRAGMTVDEIASSDLCYAPQYSPAMDNLITGANVARNKLDGHLVTVTAAEVNRMIAERQDFVFLDVRTPAEYEEVRLPHSVLIPLGSLRGRVAELPREKPVVTFCDISLRAYEASLILRHAGFEDVRVLDGGMAMWPYERQE